MECKIKIKKTGQILTIYKCSLAGWLESGEAILFNENELTNDKDKRINEKNKK